MTLVYSVLSQVATIHSLTQDSHSFQVEILEFRVLALVKFRASILPYLQVGAVKMRSWPSLSVSAAAP
jgi:hypothetical protein